jgi:hypothetical protein
MPTPRHHLPRAERHAIPVAILYRSVGETDWRPGLTENISRSGVFFRADRRLEPETTLELLLDIPPAVLSVSAGNVLRRGRVVRAEPPSPRANRPGVAAAFVDLLGTPPIDPRRI